MSKASNNPFPSILIVEGTVPTSPSAGDQRLYIDSADHVAKVVNSSGTVSPVGGGGAMVKIAETILGSTAASITFSSIPATYRTLVLSIYGRGTASAAFAEIHMQLNSDTGANYDAMRLNASGTSSTDTTDLAATSALIGFISAATAPTNAAGATEIKLHHYANTSFRKTWLGTSILDMADSSGNKFYQTGGGDYRSTSAIAAISLALNAGSFATGTVASLYGIS